MSNDAPNGYAEVNGLRMYYERRVSRRASGRLAGRIRAP
jgi:hypothetical protein